MNGLIVPFADVVDERVRDLVLHVARADAFHAFALRFLAQLLDGVLRVARAAPCRRRASSSAASDRLCFFGSSRRVSTAHIAATSSVCGAMCLPCTFCVVEVLLVDLDLFVELA